MPSEAIFTKPRPDCPNPERWTATDAWGSEAETSAFMGALCRLLRPTLVVETGTYEGDTAVAMGQALKEHGGWLDTLEIDPERAERAKARCVGLPVTVHNKPSLQYHPPGPIDLLFLDSEIDIRAEELAQFSSRCSPHAIWAVHDTARPELRRAIGDLEGVILGPAIHFPTPRGLTIGRFLS